MARGAFVKPRKREGGRKSEEEEEKEEENAVKRWVGEIVQGVGGSKAMKEAWEKERFQPMRRNYERLFEAEPWARGLVLGEEEEAKKEEEGGKEGGEVVGLKKEEKK